MRRYRRVILIPAIERSVAVALVVFAASCSTTSSTDLAYRADSLLVSKRSRTLTVYSADKPIREFRVALGGNPIGAKQFEGDERTPEGQYVIDWRNERSRFHRSLHISYPNRADVAAARAVRREPGGMIMIHGLPEKFSWIGRAHLLNDRWTDGCIAVTNTEIDELWASVPQGTPVRIVP